MYGLNIESLEVFEDPDLNAKNLTIFENLWLKY